MTSNDSHDPLDDLLNEHLRRRLDPQIGKAAAAFAARARGPVLNYEMRPKRTIGRRFAVAAALLATAAAIVLAVSVYDLNLKSDRPIAKGVYQPLGPATTAPTSQPSPQYQRIIITDVKDLGTLTLSDGTAVRQLCRYTLEQTSYVDEAHHTCVRTTVPRQQIILVSMSYY